MKKKIKFLCLCMVMLLCFSFVSVMGTSAAEALQNSVEFDVEVGFNSITIYPPEKKGDFIYYGTFNFSDAYQLEEALASLSVGDVVFEEGVEEFLITEPLIEYYYLHGGETPVLISPKKEYKVILIQVDKSTGGLLSYGVESVTTSHAPEAYDGYVGYIGKRLNVQAYAGVNTITLEPMPDDGNYIVMVMTREEGREFEKIDELELPVGSIYMENGTYITDEYIVSTLVDEEGNVQKIESGQHYAVVYIKVDSPTFPAGVVTYGVRYVSTTADLSFYENKQSFKIIKDGDANGDFDITIQDATAIQKHVASSVIIEDKHCKLCADINSDGDINIKDATAIQKCIANIENPYDIGIVAPVKA